MTTTPVGSGGGGYISCALWDKDEQYALWVGSDVGGPYYCPDVRTDSWELRATGMFNGACDQIAQCPTNGDILLVATNGGLYRTANHGDFFSLCRGGLPKPCQVWKNSAGTAYANAVCSIAWSPTVAGLVLVGGGCSRYNIHGNGGIWRSTDYARKWQFVGHGIPRDAIVHGLAMGATYALASTSKGLFRSADQGLTWTQVALGAGVSTDCRLVAIAPSDETHAYLALHATPAANPFDGGAMASTDSGLTWAFARTGLNIDVDASDANHNGYRSMVVFPTDEHIAYLTCQGYHNPRLYKTSDGAANWSSAFYAETQTPVGWLNTLNTAHPFTAALHPSHPERIAIGTSMFLLLSLNAAATWTNLYSTENPDGTSTSRGIDPTGLHSIAPSPTTAGLVVAGYWDVGVPFTADYGASWKHLTGFTTGHEAYAMEWQADGLLLWIAGGNHTTNSGKVYTWVPGASGVSSISTGLPDARCLAISRDNAAGEVLVAQYQGGLYLSTNGTSFSATGTGLPTPTSAVYVCAVCRHPSTPQTVLMAVSGTHAAGGGLYRSTDGGRNCTRLSDTTWPGLTPQSVTYTSDGSAILLAVRRGYSSRVYAGGVWRSPTGLVWTLVLDAYFATAVARGADGVPWAATGDVGGISIGPARGIWRATDELGATWEDRSSGILAGGNGAKSIPCIAPDPRNAERCYLGAAGAGVFRQHLTAVAGQVEPGTPGTPGTPGETPPVAGPAPSE